MWGAFTAMLKISAFGIAMLATLWVAPVAAQSEAPMIRTGTGDRYQIPVEWEWTEFDGFNATIRHLARTSSRLRKACAPGTVND
jgi:hypothetical protein